MTKRKSGNRRENQTACKENRQKPEQATVTFTVSGLISVGDIEKLIANECATLSTDAIQRWIDDPELCPKHELYNSLWFLENRYEFMDLNMLPVFVRHVPPDRKVFVREAIRSRIYRLEYETFYDPDSPF